MNSEAQTVSFWGSFNEGFGGDDARQEPQRAARSKQIDRAPIGRCARPQRRFGIWPRSKQDEPGTGSTVSPRQTTTQLSGWLHLCYIYILSSGRNGRTPNTTRADAEVAVETTGPLDTRSGNPGSNVHPKMQGILHAPQASLGRDGCRVPCLCFCAISATGGSGESGFPTPATQCHAVFFLSSEFAVGRSFRQDGHSSKWGTTPVVRLSAQDRLRPRKCNQERGTETLDTPPRKGPKAS